MTRAANLRSRFLTLHTDPPSTPTPGILVMPNPWDIGSAKILAEAGALAIATTSSGHAASMGRLDQTVDRGELLAHTAELAAAVDLPLNVDAEDCFSDDSAGVGETAALIAQTDAAGFSIEDYNPRTASLLSLEAAAERVAAAKEAGDDLVVTARAENYLYGAPDIDDTIKRLVAYSLAGADVVYAPGVVTLDDITRLVTEVDCPVNVLALPGTPTIAELAAAGVARVSVGGLFAWAAYGALASAATELLTTGTSDYISGVLPGNVANAAFS